MPFNLPSNLCANPDSFLRKPRTSEVIETPPAPAPPRYNWVASGEAVGTQDSTIRTLYPPSSHTIASIEETETSIHPDDNTVIGKQIIEPTSKTPIVPGSSDHTTPQIEMSTLTQDEIINTLQSKVARLEKERAEWEARAQVSMADCDRIETLERSVAQLSLEQGPTTPRSSGSNNPFLAYQANAHTPTPAGPHDQQTASIRVGQPFPASPVPISNQVPASHQFFVRPVRDEARTVTFEHREARRSEHRTPSARGDNELSKPKKVYACDLKLSEIPKFTGPSESPAALFNWRRLIEQFFELKNVSDDRQRFIILGSVMVEPRAGAWYVNSRRELEGLSWDAVMHEMASETLPTGWLEDTEKSIRQLRMGNTEDFKGYVGRARDLYNIVQVKTSLTARNLAEYIVWGTPDVFQRWIKDRGLLHVQEFRLLPFISAANNVWDLVVASNLVTRNHGRQPTVQNNGATPKAGPNNVTSDTRTLEQRADQAWRYFSYMRHLGLCGIC